MDSHSTNTRAELHLSKSEKRSRISKNPPQPFASTCCITNASFTGRAAGRTQALALLEMHCIRSPIQSMHAGLFQYRSCHVPC
jgi:hypothetical protein